MSEYIEVLLLVLLATVKFIAAAGILLAKNTTHPIHGFMILLAGGSIGTLVFYYLGGKINLLLQKVIKKKQKKKFSWMNRLIVRVKSNYGLIGLSLLGPVLFSIPVGCFLAARFYADNRNTLSIMLGAVLFWSIILSSFKLLYT